MVNPLSRVAMKNILEKKKDNLIIERDVKTLSDFAKDKGQKSTSRSNNSYTNSQDSYSKNSYNAKKTNNDKIMEKDLEISSLVKDLIHGSAKVKKENSINSAITLEEAIEKIKQ